MYIVSHNEAADTATGEAGGGSPPPQVVDAPGASSS